MTVNMPVLLSSALETVRPIKAVGLSLTASLRDRSQAQLTASHDESPIPMRSFIDVYTQKGFFATFRVTNSALSNERGRVYTLTHAIDTLRDSVYQMQGTFEGTKQEFLSSIFAYQKEARWQLGYVEDGESAYKSPNINYTKLSDLFSRYLQDNPDVYPSYDFTSIPWTVHILKLPTAISARFSLTRNADTCNIVYDDKNMCNRLYLSVNTPEKVNGITKYNTELRVYENAASIAQYGVIEKTASVKTDEITNGDANAWAQAFLEKYAQPEVNITVDGYELYKQTGEIYDEASVSKRALVSMPDYGTSTTQRIESIQYPDVLNAPTAIVVSLATKQKTFTTAISNLEQEVEKVGGTAGGAALSAADAEEVTAWSLIMQKVEEAVNATGIIALWETGIVIDAVTGAKIYSLSQGFDAVNNEIMVNRAAIETNSDQILLAVEQGQNNASAITANANALSLKVSKNGVISEINQTSETVKISASKIDLDGLVTASELQTAIADINYQSSQAIETLFVSANQTDFNFLIASSFILGDTLISKKPISMGPITTGQVLAVSTASLDLSHSHAVSVAADGTVTLGAPSVTGGNFKIADTKVYKDGVSAAKDSVTATLSGWSTGTNTVTLSNGKPYPVALPSFNAASTTFSTITHKATVYFYSNEIPNTRLYEHVVDASAVYQQGLEDAQGGDVEITLSQSGWINGLNIVSALNGSEVIDTETVALPTFTVSGGDTFVNKKTTVSFYTASVNGALKSKEVDASGVYTDGANSVEMTPLNAAGWVNGIYTVHASNDKNYNVNLPEIKTSVTSFNATSHKALAYSTTGSLSAILSSVEVDATSVYQQGLNDAQIEVTLSASGWATNKNTVSAKNGETTIATIDIAPPALSYEMGDFNANTNKAVVAIFSEASRFPALDFEVDASSVYNNGTEKGKAAVTATVDPKWLITGTRYVRLSNGKTYAVTLPSFSSSTSEFNSDHKMSVWFFAEEVTTQPLVTVEVDASSVYSDGAAGVTLSSAGWINGVNSVKASNGKAYNVNLPSFEVSGGETFVNKKTTVFFSTASVSQPLKSVEVDASSVYSDGAAGVTLSSAGWINGVNSVKASNGKAYNVNLPTLTVNTTAFNATTHKATAYVTTPSVTHIIAQTEVDASGVYDAGYAAGWAAAAAIFDMTWSGGTYKETLTITHAGETPDSENASDTVKITLSATQSAITSPAQNTLFASCAARAYANVNGEGAIQRAYANDSVTATGRLGTS